MNVEITKKEYRDLLDVLHMAEWVMHAHETGKDPRTKKYDAIIQKFYALAKDMGQESLIEYDPGVREYFATRKFDDTTESWEFIDDFTDDSFWDELIHRIADRDLARTVGGYDQLDKLSATERFRIEGPVLEKYSQEFDKHGLDRLEIVERFGQARSSAPATHD